MSGPRPLLPLRFYLIFTFLLYVESKIGMFTEFFMEDILEYINTSTIRHMFDMNLLLSNLD